MDWYYVESRQQRGPVSRSELDRRVAAGELPGDVLAWCAGLPNWLPYPEAVAAAKSLVAPAAAASQLAPGEVCCHECGQVLPASETAQFGVRHVCAACKPVFVQKLQEGVPLTAAPAVARLGPQQRNPQAVTGFVLGLVAVSVMFCLSCFGFVPGIPLAIIGLVLSLRGWRAAKQDPRLPHRGLGLAGLVLSLVALALSLVLALAMGGLFTFSMFEGLKK